MPISENEKDDIKTTVLIELERMFTVITRLYNPHDMPGHLKYLLTVEKAMKERLFQME